MDRRQFLKCSGTCVGAGVAGLSLAGPAHPQPEPLLSGQQSAVQATPPPAATSLSTAQPVRPRYAFEIDIVEGRCGPHRAGQTFKYPEEKGKICPWLMDSMNGAIRVLEYGGTMPWLYAGTPYEKVIDPEGLTTEFIRCPDPSRVVVARISRRRV